MTSQPISCLPSLAPEIFARVRLRTIFECCKWDPQVEDVSTLAEFPIVLSREEWRYLASSAEQLAAETLAAERELLHKSDLLKQLGLPHCIRRVLNRLSAVDFPTGAARVMRFDFHGTPDGWRISEANTDVPGGFIEASGFTCLMASHYTEAEPTGDPAAAYVEEMLKAVGTKPTIALVHATAYTDDRQVMMYLARQIESRGATAVLISPSHLRWNDGFAEIDSASNAGRVDLLVRFFPAEWLPNLPSRCGWKHFFGRNKTPLSNPASALLTQSKRLPLVWDLLATKLPTWRALLPETCDPRQVPWQSGDWVLKPAFGRVGEGVGIPHVTDATEWKRIARDVRRHPRYWVAQRRFTAEPIQTEGGPAFPCIGVYTVNSRAIGVYGRLARLPLINNRARDVAVLVRRPGTGESGFTNNGGSEHECRRNLSSVGA